MRHGRALLAIAFLGAPALFLGQSAYGGDAVTPASSSAPSAVASSAAAPVAAGDAGGPVRHDPDNKTAIAEWMEKCVQGNAKYLARDIPGAIDLYRQAIQLAPKKPLAHYLLGEAQLAAQNMPEAEASLKNAEAASDDRNAELRAKILFVTADLWEREKKWDAAKSAWSAYSEYAAKHGDAGVAPSTPTARIQAIDDMLKQDKAYEVVRQRIADALKNPQLLATPDAGPSKAPKKK